jgi:hypothetical protein
MRLLLPLGVIAVATVALIPRPAETNGPRRSDRDRAIARGLAFIYTTAKAPANFSDYGHDYLWCFCTIARTSADPELASAAWRLGHELALRWRSEHRRLGHASGANELYELVSGSQSADCLGVGADSFNEELRRAATRLTAEEVLGFDPAKEPPPGDIPRPCPKCQAENARGARTCRRCGAGLVMRSRYAVYCDALIVTYTGDRYGMRLGASLKDVVQWRPHMLPYPEPIDDDDRVHKRAAYAITHLVYTLNDYSRLRLRRDWLPDEFAFLSSHVMKCIAAGDGELLGEYMDTLKSFGLTESDDLIAAGSRFLLASQNPDGSWGDAGDQDIYDRYHSTWTAIDGLRDYRWQGEGVNAAAALHLPDKP